MKTVFFIFLLLINGINTYAANCGQNCNDNTDCTALCKQCDQGPPGGACITCCDNPSEEDCDLQPPCVWTPAGNPAGECRNLAGLSCGAGVSEISENAPKSIWIVMALFVSVLLPVLMIWRNHKQIAKK